MQCAFAVEQRRDAWANDQRWRRGAVSLCFVNNIMEPNSFEGL